MRKYLIIGIVVVFVVVALTAYNKASASPNIVLRVFNANNQITDEKTSSEFDLSKTKFFSNGFIAQEITVSGKQRIQHYYIDNGRIIKAGLGVEGIILDGTEAGYIISANVKSIDGQPFYQVYGYQ